MIDLVKNDNEQPLISIIIPVYNVEKYIDRCVRSVINQTQKNFEVILIDDCSLDNSIAISKNITDQYCKNDISFVYLRHDKNQGLSASRNTGIKQAQGTYLYFLDSDDYLDEHCVANFLKLCKKYPEVDLVQGNADSNSRQMRNALQVIKRYPDFIADKLLIQRLLLVPRLFPVTSWNKLIRKDLLISNNIWFQKGIIHEDVHFAYHLSKVIRNIAIVKNITYFYLVRPNSIMTNAKLDLEFKSLNFLIDDMMANITPSCKIYQRHRFAVLFFYNIVSKQLYGIEKDVVETYIKIFAKSDSWGKVILGIWNFFPISIKRQKHFALSISWIYSIF